MSDSIPLSPKLGLRPVITTCPRCGEKSNSIVLVGNGRVYTCTTCGRNHVAYKKPSKCGCEGEVRPGFTVKPYDESMPILGDLCAACEKEFAEHAEAVKQGGVYFRCADCSAQGVIKGTSEFARRVREQWKLAAPEPCGVEFTKADCPQCSERA
jgi:DNA-directed RNA polymerase subunit RPC12/RpoP